MRTIYGRLLCYLTSLLLFAFRKLKNHFVGISCRNKLGTFQRTISAMLVRKINPALAIYGLKNGASRCHETKP